MNNMDINRQRVFCDKYNIIAKLKLSATQRVFFSKKCSPRMKNLLFSYFLTDICQREHPMHCPAKGSLSDIIGSPA